MHRQQALRANSFQGLAVHRMKSRENPDVSRVVAQHSVVASNTLHKRARLHSRSPQSQYRTRLSTSERSPEVRAHFHGMQDRREQKTMLVAALPVKARARLERPRRIRAVCRRRRHRACQSDHRTLHPILQRDFSRFPRRTFPSNLRQPCPSCRCHLRPQVAACLASDVVLVVAALAAAQAC